MVLAFVLTVDAQYYPGGSGGSTSLNATTFVFDGDSMTAWTNGDVASGNYNDYPDRLMNLPPCYFHAGVYDFAVSSRKVADVLAHYSTGTGAVKGTKKIVFPWMGYNDVNVGGETDSTIESGLQSYWQQAKAQSYYVVGFTFHTNALWTHAQLVQWTNVTTWIKGPGAVYYNTLIDEAAFMTNYTLQCLGGIHLDAANNAQLATLISTNAAILKFLGTPALDATVQSRVGFFDAISGDSNQISLNAGTVNCQNLDLIDDDFSFIIGNGIDEWRFGSFADQTTFGLYSYSAPGAVWNTGQAGTTTFYYPVVATSLSAPSITLNGVTETSWPGAAGGQPQTPIAQAVNVAGYPFTNISQLIVGGSGSGASNTVVSNSIFSSSNGVRTVAFTNGGVLVGSGTAYPFTIGNGNWISDAVPFIQPVAASSPGVLDVLSTSATQDSWVDIGDPYSVALPNGTYLMARMFNSAITPYADIDVKGLGMGLAGALVLNNITFAGVGAQSSSTAIGFNTNPPAIAQWFAELDQAIGSRFIAANASAGTGAYSTFEAANSALDSQYLRLVMDGTGASGLGGLFTPNTGLLQLASGPTNLVIVDANTSGAIDFATGGTALSNIRMRIGSTGNVGIGTVTPAALFTVNGAGIVSNTLTASAFICIGATGTNIFSPSNQSETITLPPLTQPSPWLTSGSNSVSNVWGTAVSDVTLTSGAAQIIWSNQIPVAVGLGSNLVFTACLIDFQDLNYQTGATHCGTTNTYFVFTNSPAVSAAGGVLLGASTTLTVVGTSTTTYPLTAYASAAGFAIYDVNGATHHVTARWNLSWHY
jgi:hypothetical protein